MYHTIYIDCIFTHIFQVKVSLHFVFIRSLQFNVKNIRHHHHLQPLTIIYKHICISKRVIIYLHSNIEFLSFYHPHHA